MRFTDKKYFKTEHICLPIQFTCKWSPMSMHYVFSGKLAVIGFNSVFIELSVKILVLPIVV